MFNCMFVIISAYLAKGPVLGSWSVRKSFSYSDTCSYPRTNYYYQYRETSGIPEHKSNYQFLCGDKCLYRDPIDDDVSEFCTCGNNTILDNDRFCCTPPAVKCNKTQEGAVCHEGVVQSVNSDSRCNTKCYNDYFASKFLGQNAHYSCPDKCVDWKDWCHGVSFCDQDESICGEELRCPDGWGKNKYIINTTPVRSYCHKDPQTLNDNAYDTIDRSDEDVFKVDAARTRIDFTAIKSCERYSYPGMECSGTCVLNNQWCSDESPSYCAESGIFTNDPVLCSNHTFWKNIPCLQTINRTLVQGKRCKGTIQHCYWPLSNDNNTEWQSTCRDLSDRVFDSERLCPDSPDQICLDSCNDPATGCTACTNTSYFSCTKSNTCIHPSLYCDGHPQCEHGEDEVLENCKNEYILRNLLPETATFRCRSKMYPIIETYATACDGITECLNEDDEKFCSGYSILKQILVSTSILIALMYLGLKFGRIAKNKDEFQLETLKQDLHSDILRTYSENHDNNEVLEKLNIFLLNIIFSKRTEITNAFYKRLYSIEEVFHNGDKAEIYSCLHKNFDPMIMERVDASQFKGLEQKFIDFTERLFQRRFITGTKNFIISHEWLTIFLNTLTRLVKLEIKYIDLIKDLSLTLSLFFIVGGIQALQDFGMNFSMGIVLCLMTTVFFPIFFATLHLVTTNPFMIFGGGTELIKHSWKKIGMIAFCFLFSIFNPILLLNAYERAKEKTRLMAKSMDERVGV